MKAIKRHMYSNVKLYKDKKGSNLQLNFVQTSQPSTVPTRKLVGWSRRKP